MSLNLCNTDDKSTFVKVVAWYHLETSNYLNQCRPKWVPIAFSQLTWSSQPSLVHRTWQLILHPGHMPNGPFTRYAKLWVAHAPGMPGTFSPQPRVSDLDMHHGTCVTHVPWCMSGSLTSGFLWIRCRGKRSRHSRRMHNPQFYVSGKRPYGHATCYHGYVRW